MRQIFLVGLGGGLGALTRYKLGGFILHHTADWKFPAGTFSVNVLGCFAAGFLAALVERHDAFSPDLRLFLFTGILGGFTTFSAFGLDTIYLFQRQEPFWAAANILASISAGLAALWLGINLIP